MLESFYEWQKDSTVDVWMGSKYACGLYFIYQNIQRPNVYLFFLFVCLFV